MSPMQSTTRSIGELEPLGDRLRDARVGLVVDEQVDVVERESGELDRVAAWSSTSAAVALLNVV